MEKKYDHAAAEEKWEEFWQEQKLFAFDRNSDRPVYSVDTPPPTVSGALHIGHVFSYTHTDIQVRFWRMCGYNVFYPMGFDDNGLPSERLTEKELGIKGAETPRRDFREKCLHVVTKYEEEFQRLWSRMGISVDWSLTYRTIDDLCCRIAQRSFLDLYRKGRVYRRREPVIWCTECGTAIAQAELEAKELESVFSDVVFTVDGKPLVIATTRPELLPACVAVFVHPNDARHRALIGRKAKTPAFDIEVPIMADDRVDMEKGTGVVMCCTFGDRQDVEWWRDGDLNTRIAIDEDGRMNDLAGEFVGLHILDARKRITEKLRQEGLIRSERPILHEVNTHERCGTEQQFLILEQWFVRVLDIKDKLVAQADKINWYPPHMKKRYVNWVENLAWDWTVSRQRFFGVPFPVWYCKECGKIILADDSELPVDPLYDSPSRKCECGSNAAEGDSDVMDTWATSSMTPHINYRWGEPDEIAGIYPMSLRPQAHEIIRTWAFYTILKSLLHNDRIPWNDITISGFITVPSSDNSRFKAEKISKSKHGELFSPFSLIREYGADCLRLWASNAPLGRDMPLNPEDFKKGKRTLTKLWNAFRFAGMHLEDFDPSAKPPELELADKWLFAKEERAVRRATGLFKSYDFRTGRLEIDNLFWSTFCDNYLEIVKDRLYSPDVRGADARRSAQHALFHVGLDILRLYAPYVPHITEEIYHNIFKERCGKESIHACGWPEQPAVPVDEEALAAGELLIHVLGSVRRYKAARKVSMKSKLKSLIITASQERIRLLEMVRDDLQPVTQSEKLEFEESALETSMTVRIIDDAEFEEEIRLE